MILISSIDILNHKFIIYFFIISLFLFFFALMASHGSRSGSTSGMSEGKLSFDFENEKCWTVVRIIKFPVCIV